MTSLLDFTVATIEAIGTKSALRSGKGFRMQCPAHNGQDRNLFIGDGDNRLIMTCHSHHCDPRDIMESAGLSIKDIYYEQLNTEQKSEYKSQITIRKLIEELSHELVIVTLWITDYSEGVYPRVSNDTERTKKAFTRVQRVLKHLEGKL